MTRPNVTYQEALDGAVARLEQRGLISRDPVSGAAGIGGGGIVVLSDLVVLLIAQTAGEDQSPAVTLAHEVGHIYREALRALTGEVATDVPDDEVAAAVADTKTLLAEIASRHDDGGAGVPA